MISSKTKKVALYILLFYSIAIALRYYLIIIKPDFYIQSNEQIQSLLSGISPLIGGLILVKLLGRPNDLKLFSVGFWKTVLVIILPVFLFFVMATINSGEPDYAITLVISTSILYAIFEEYGWRGYLQSELKEIKPIYKYLIISVLWYVWHLDFGLDTAHLLSYFFVLMGSIGIGYVADASKSLVLPSLFHMFFNILFTNSLQGITTIQRVVIMSICAVSVIFIMWQHKRKERIQNSKITI